MPPSSLGYRVVVIEDDDTFRDFVVQALQRAGFDAQTFAHPEPALRMLPSFQPHVVLLDLYLGKTTGLAVLGDIHAIDADLPVVLMTAAGDIRKAIGAIKAGAYDFIEKPFDLDHVTKLLTHAAERHRLVAENRALTGRLGLVGGLERILVGASRAMHGLRETLLRIAPMPANVIVLGETGTGKELVARCLHEFSGRAGPFVAINCAAVPESLFEGELFGHEAGAYTGATRQRIGEIEQASGGTLLLDEIETMPMHLQVKLLRVLQEREIKRLGSGRAIAVDLRVVAATKVDLKTLSQEGRFRPDLFYRLNVATLRIPPLRDRREDIPMLFAHFLHEAGLRFGTPAPVLPHGLHQQLLAHDWPGNVRELRNVAEQCQLGVPLSLPADGHASGPSLDDAMAAFERTVIEGALQRCDGNANAACEELHVNYATLYRRMKRYEIDLQRFRRKV